MFSYSGVITACAGFSGLPNGTPHIVPNIVDAYVFPDKSEEISNSEFKSLKISDYIDNKKEENLTPDRTSSENRDVEYSNGSNSGSDAILNNSEKNVRQDNLEIRNNEFNSEELCKAPLFKGYKFKKSESLTGYILCSENNKGYFIKNIVEAEVELDNKKYLSEKERYNKIVKSINEVADDLHNTKHADMDNKRKMYEDVVDMIGVVVEDLNKANMTKNDKQTIYNKLVSVTEKVKNDLFINSNNCIFK